VKSSNFIKIICFIILLSFIIIIISCEQIVEDWEVTKLTDDFIEWYAKNYPIEASWMGIHGYDNQLDRYNADHVEQIKKQLKRFKFRITLVDTSSISFNSTVNLHIIIKKIDFLFHELNEWERLHTDSFFYMKRLFDAFDIFSFQLSDSLNTNSNNILGRIKKTPEYLTDAQNNLKKIDSINIDCSLTQIGILKNKILSQVSETPVFDSLMLDSLIYYSEIMFDSLDVFQNFLMNEKDKIQPVSCLPTKEIYQLRINNLLKQEIQIDTLIKIIKMDYQNTKNKMTALAKYYFIEQKKNYENIGNGRICQLLINEVNKDIPRRDKIISLCKEIDNYHKLFVNEIATLSMPTDYLINVAWDKSVKIKPDQLIELKTKGLLDDSSHFLIRLEPIPDDMEWNDQLIWLRKYNNSAIKAAMLLHGFPIPYNYWFNIREELPEAVKAFPDQVNINGLSFYLAFGFVELGIGGYDPLLEFTLLQNYANICYLALIELQYYSGKFSDFQIDSLVSANKLINMSNSSKAMQLIQCYPGQNLITFWGVRKLNKIEKICSQIIKRKFNKREFYKNLLKQGPIPIDLLEKKLFKYYKN